MKHAIAYLLIFLCFSCTVSAKPPNILIFLADDLGWADLGFQGSSDIRTPHIDRLAANSIRFTDGHVTASVCSPSRAGLLTGRYQQRFGHEANSPPPDQGMDLKQQTMGGALKNCGYRTGLVGKWHLGNADRFYPTERGFDSFYGLREGSRSYFFNPDREDKPSSTKRIEKNGETVPFDGYLTDVFGEQAIEFLQHDSEQPFFLYLSFTAPHGPMHATEEDLKRFKNITDKKRRTYAAMIWAMDRAIGNVLDALDQSGQADNTIVWFLSDNGGATGNGSINLPLAGHKGIKFEGGIRVPFLMRWPERFSTGKVYDGLVSSMDIFATSLAAAGGNVSDAHLDGVDLVPFLTGKETGPPHQQLFWHKLWFSAMRDDIWKLIYVKDYGYALYNMSTDPEEKHNIATKHTERVESMKNQMNTWKAAMEQPRWDEAMRWFHVHYKNHVNIIEGKN